MTHQFATVRDFTDRYGEAEALALTRLEDPTATTIDEDLLNRRLQDASQMLASYLPDLTAPYPVVVVDNCCVLARARLDQGKPREHVQIEGDKALAWCRDVARGLAKIPGLEPSQTLPVRGDVLLESDEEVFTEAKFCGY